MRSRRSLWDEAFRTLGKWDRQSITFENAKDHLLPTEILAIVQSKKEECIRKQWKYTKSNGEQVVLREVFEKMAGWIDKFKQVGDLMAQYDPAHAIAWMSSKSRLQASVSDIQTYGAMMEGVEVVSSVIARYTEVERQTLHGNSILKTQLEGALIKLYATVLRYLGHARAYYSQSSGVSEERIFKSALRPSKLGVMEHLEQVKGEESETHKLVMLVQAEDQRNKLTSLHSAVRGLKENLLSFNIPIEERRLRFVKWLEPVYTNSDYDNALRSRQEDTCHWIFERPQFQAWASPPKEGPGLLWIHGPPGFGKTVLCARLVQYLITERPQSVAYFFCVSENEAKREPLAILRSWLAQLVEQNDRALEAAETVHKSNYAQEPTISVLWRLFQNICRALDKCTLVIDGFDECTTINSTSRFHTIDGRSSFLQQLLIEASHTKARILLVSRDSADIRVSLVNDSANPNDVDILEYGIDRTDTKGDIHRCSVQMVDSQLSRKPQKLKDELANTAADRSDGMFLWLHLLRQELSPGENAKMLRKIVSQMPDRIEQAYERDLGRLGELRKDQRTRAVTILRWILFAVRPLTVRELAEALVLSSADSEDSYPEDDLPDWWTEDDVDGDYVNDIIRNPCGSLVELRPSGENTHLASHTVHFVHFSVKEYLLRPNEEGRPLAYTLCFPDIVTEHELLAQLCLRYLCYDVFGDESQNTKEVSKNRGIDIYPFLSYAAHSWHVHATKNSTMSESIQHYAEKLFNPATSNWKMWSEVFEVELDTASESGDDEESSYDSQDGESDDQPASHQSFTDTGNPIYYASLLGLTDIIKSLQEQGLDCTASGGRYGFPLQAAVINGHQAAAEYLVQHGANVSQVGGIFGTAVSAAAALGSEPLFNFLVAQDADISGTDANGWAPIHYACNNDKANIVKSLLAKGVDISVRSNSGQHPLHLASARGSLEIVELLLQAGADPNTPSGSGLPPLFAALGCGNDEVIATLIKHGADVDARSPSGMTSLHSAAMSDTVSAARMLLAHNASVDARYSSGWTALHYSQSTDFSQVLLDHGAQVNAISDQGWTPLHLAAENGQAQMVRWLLGHGANVDAENSSSVTVLHLAVGHNELPIVEVLLDHGADAFKYDIEGDTALDLAIQKGYGDVVSMLFEHRGICARKLQQTEGHPHGSLAKLHDDIRMLDKDLQRAAYFQKVEEVALLLNRDPPNFTLDGALHAAVLGGSDKITMLLLQHGADLHSVAATNNRTVLHTAAARGDHSLLLVLLDHGANIFARDVIRSDPLALAVGCGIARLGIVKLLIERGALAWKTKNSEGAHSRKSHDEGGGDSLTQDTGGSSPPSPAGDSAAQYSTTLNGHWAGSYTYAHWMIGVREPTTLNINLPDSPGSESGSTFACHDKDLYGDFDITGQVFPGNLVRWVKLYESHGWLYSGVLDTEARTITGNWGRNSELWHGSFELGRESQPEKDIEA
ncbi:hypothetical protein FGG08_003912 [Glutinoglossum americanum]|uniref:NACHT domain-containing protein n=1 Tax=Glutinoglossum americanum TaxID=1670608 RepID=A0A9P8ICE2_9PEZI|nr:hypothetical protein FGG08_003912 [Glutinoglossum americanum]